MKRTERREGRPQGGERQAPFALRAKAEDQPNDGWTLDGYGAVFNRTTVIDSWEGVFRELIAGGSMKKSFRESPPIIQYDHGRHPMIGSMPVAELKSVVEESDPELAPDGGAHIIGRMNQNWLIEPLRDCLATRQINGMSFRFEVVRESWQTYDGKKIKDEEELLVELRKTWNGDVPQEELPIRTLQELRVPEMGPVAWPAYSDTSVGVRSINLDELGSDPDQRAALARKLFAVPNLGAMHKRDDDAPQTTDSREDETAGEHPSESNDAPQSTDSREDETAGKHPSNPHKKAMLYRMEYNTMQLAKMTRKDSSHE